MQVQVSGTECDDREYPFLGVCGAVVVLFVENSVGTVVVDTPDDYVVGYYSDEWDMDMFEPFDGVVRLANDDVDMSEAD